ncbi:MAG: hypothetical protein JXL80_13585 [Planctomycetes bacterium]|nr:hypothetical protein [Planctomycetota bacterium]
MSPTDTKDRAGPARPVALLRVLLVSLAAAALTAAWGRDAHEVVTREGLSQLPPPLVTELDNDPMLAAILSQVMGPDKRVAQLRTEAQRLQGELDAATGEADKKRLGPQAEAAWRRYRQERSKHFFDLDALTDEPPPYATFPHDHKTAALKAAEYLLQHKPQEAAELLGEDPKNPATRYDPKDRSRWAQLGEAALARHGTLPWVIRDQVLRLEETFRQGRHDRLAEVIGDLSHYVGDLYQPLHTTQNYDGQATGNRGVHAAFEIYLVIRQKSLEPQRYERLPPQYLSPYDAVEDVPAAVFAQVGRNAKLAEQIFAADTEARKRSGATDEDFAYLKTLDREAADDLFRRKDTQGLDARQKRLLRHSEELSRILTEEYDDLPRRAMGVAASMVSSLVYTAWLHAGRPDPSASGAAAEKDAERPLISWDLVIFGGLAALMLTMLLRRRRPPTAR